jgi:hypothetical protein
MQHFDSHPEPTAATDSRHGDDMDAATAERFLYLTDRILGLEAELAEARYRADMARLGHAAAIEHEAALLAFVEEMKRSSTWRAGTMLGHPVRAVRGLSNRYRLSAIRRDSKR